MGLQIVGVVSVALWTAVTITLTFLIIKATVGLRVDANVAAMSELIDASFTPPNHAFLFTDEMPTTGEDAEIITIDWGAVMYNSRFVYDVENVIKVRTGEEGYDALQDVE